MHLHVVRKLKLSVKLYAIDAIAKSDSVTTKGLKSGARRVIMLPLRVRTRVKYQMVISPTSGGRARSREVAGWK